MQKTDWKDTLKSIKDSEPKQEAPKEYPKPRTVKFKCHIKARQTGSNLERLLATTIKDYRRVHPQDMFVRLGVYFKSVSVKRVGGWPDDSTPELDMEAAADSIGDLTHSMLVRNKNVFMRTDKGFFRFYNLR